MVVFLMQVACVLHFLDERRKLQIFNINVDWCIGIYLYRFAEYIKPAISFERLLFLKFFSKKHDKLEIGSRYGFLSYVNLITFYENFLISRLYLSNRVVNNSLMSAHQNLATRIYLSVSRLLYRSKIQLRWYSFIYIFVWTCVNKDLTLLTNYLMTKIGRMHFKKHKKFFSLLRYIYFCSLKCLLQLGFVSGFLCKISGKIGLAGSVKTKSLIFAYGRTRLSNKGGLLKTSITQIWTRTGVLGLRMYLIY